MAAVAKRPREIFLAALSLPDDARDAYLDQACESDAGLRSRVAALLGAHRASGTIDANSGPQSPTNPVPSPVDEPLGSMIGPYKLREVLGEGGMGTVYVAEQERPVRRRVALKVIKPGMDTREVIARFEAERQALALMDHPHIAKVLDAGTTGEESGVRNQESGSLLTPDPCPLTPASRPYFVMELVRGVPITDYCDQAGAGLRERLELFVKVCQAIQHAHQKGVIHRDIKPSNVLVTLHDGVPVPKVIDFGVAKAINQRLSEHTMYTRMAQMLGTPMYMSPEQAELSGLDVDTRSDVYSLGVLLYELLTGSTPFDAETLKQAGYDEMRRIIREDEPPRPSQRVSTLAAEKLSTVSQQRGVDSRRLKSLLYGDLDWIVMKALEKDRSRRYETANGLARDVQRYLADEPVEACPPSTGYRLRKYARRNAGALVSGGLVAGALLVGTAVSVWHAIEANSARKTAEVEREKAELQQRRAEESFKDSLEAVERMLTRAAGEKLSRIPGAESIRRQLLEDALKFYQRFLRERGHDPELRFEVAQAWSRVGLIRHRLSQYAEAKSALEESVAIAESLRDDHPDDSRFLALLIDALLWMNVPDQAGSDEEHLLNRALAACEHLQRLFPNKVEYRLKAAEIQAFLAGVYSHTGRTPKAIDLIREVIDTQTVLLSQLPDRFSDRKQLVYNQRQLAELVAERDFEGAAELLAEAESSAEALIHAGADDAELALAIVLELRAKILDGRDRIAEQEQIVRRGIAVLDPYVAARLDMPFPRRYWARHRNLLGRILIRTAREHEAEQWFRQVREAARDRDPTDWLHELMTAHQELCSLLIRTDRIQEARIDCFEMIAILDRLAPAAGNPLHIAARSRIAGSLNTCAWNFHAAGQTSDAEQAFRQAIEQYRKLVELAPDDHAWRRELAVNLGHITEVQWAPERYPEAMRNLEEARALLVPLIESRPTEHSYRDRLCLVEMGIARRLFENRRYDEAERHARAAVELAQSLETPEIDAHICWDCAEARYWLGKVLEAQQRFDEAETRYRQAIVGRVTALDRPSSSNVRQIKGLLDRQTEFADFLARREQWSQAADAYRQALAVVERHATHLGEEDTRPRTQHLQSQLGRVLERIQ